MGVLRRFQHQRIQHAGSTRILKNHHARTRFGRRRCRDSTLSSAINYLRRSHGGRQLTPTRRKVRRDDDINAPRLKNGGYRQTNGSGADQYGDIISGNARTIHSVNGDTQRLYKGGRLGR